MQKSGSSHTQVFTDIAELLTLDGVDRKQGRRISQADLGEIRDAVLVSREGRVAWVGSHAEFARQEKTILRPSDEVLRTSFGGASVIPGLIDCHTHTVFAGNRVQEFEWRMAGQTYQEISAKGGGILSTVAATRACPERELTALTQKRVRRFVDQGVTSLEIKSGYGLDLETEIKCLRVARALSGPRVIATYLGAHSRSPDFADLSQYIEFINDKVLPEVAAGKLADRADIYIEKGFYDLRLARAYLEKAKALGLQVTAHVEQLSDFGGTGLALEFEPQSVDHVVHLNAQDVARVSAADTTAVLLPASDFYLKMRYPPARELIDQGGRVALSTDFNPGTSPTQDLSLVGVLARLEMKMTLAEVMASFTVGAAWALGIESEAGSLSIGKGCDFAVIEGSWRELFYSVGQHPVHATYRAGEEL